MYFMILTLCEWAILFHFYWSQPVLKKIDNSVHLCLVRYLRMNPLSSIMLLQAFEVALYQAEILLCS